MDSPMGNHDKEKDRDIGARPDSLRRSRKLDHEETQNPQRRPGTSSRGRDPTPFPGHQRRSRAELLSTSSPRPRTPYVPIETTFRPKTPRAGDVLTQLTKYFPQSSKPRTSFKPKKSEKKTGPPTPLIPVRIPEIAEAVAKAEEEDYRKLKERKNEVDTYYMNSWIEPGLVSLSSTPIPKEVYMKPTEPSSEPKDSCYKSSEYNGEKADYSNRPKTAPGRRRQYMASGEAPTDAKSEKEKCEPNILDALGNAAAADYVVEPGDSYFCLKQECLIRDPKTFLPMGPDVPFEITVQNCNVGSDNFSTQVNCGPSAGGSTELMDFVLRPTTEAFLLPPLPPPPPAHDLNDNDSNDGTSIDSDILDSNSELNYHTQPLSGPAPAPTQGHDDRVSESESSDEVSESVDKTVSQYGELRDLRSDELEAMGILPTSNRPSILIRPNSPMPSPSEVQFKSGCDEVAVTYLLAAPKPNQFGRGWKSSTIDWTTLKVLNLDDSIEYNELMNLFPRATGVTYPVYDREGPATKKPKRYAYILFKNAHDAKMAIEKMDGTSIFGTRLDIEYRLLES